MSFLPLEGGRSFLDDPFLVDWLDQNPEAWVITDGTGIIVYVNPAFERVTGYARADTHGRTPSILKSGVQGPEFYSDLWRTLLSGSAFRGVFVNRRKNGELYHADNVIWPVRDELGAIRHFACETRDVSVRVRDVAKLEHEATHDPLTDLPNRSLFLDRLEVALHHALRRNEGLVVAMLDLDGFRETNNRYGHLGGDAVLQAVARRSVSCVREADTVARIGGDELAMILPNADESGATAVLEKIRAASARPVPHGDQIIGTSVSIGAAVFPRDAKESWDLRRRADEAMYAGKRLGGDCVRFYRPR
jgi:diguanylate cyclase (GGDEF)-like protein/PAS domain S-box-containing protein